MIICSFKDLPRYEALNPNFKKAFDWVMKTDLAKLELGKVEIDGEKVFALVQKYKTQAVSEKFFEAHRKYIDIQIIVNGAEKMDCADTSLLSELKPYDESRDFQELDGKTIETVDLVPNIACVLFPEDAHKPGLHPDGKTVSENSKICVKIAC